MAKQSQSKVGGVIGGVLGVLIVGGMAASPLYLKQFRATDRKLDSAVQDEVEHIRRVVLNLDEHLGTIADIYENLGDDERLDSSAIEAILAETPEIIGDSRTKALNHTAQILRTVESEDQKRNIRIEGVDRVQSGKLNIRTALRDLRGKFLADHEKLIREADNVARSLQTAGAGNHLNANRMKAILNQAKGRIQRNRAEFEQWQAAQVCRQAEVLAGVAAELHGQSEALELQNRDRIINDIDNRIANQDRQIREVSGVVSQLDQLISTQEQRLAELDAAAQEARRKLAALEASGAAIHSEDSEYALFSNTARQAELEAAAIRNGTLVDAVLAGDEFEDMLTRTYKGGTPRPGIRDLKPRLAQLQEHVAGLEATKATLQEQKATIEEQARQLEDQIAAIDEIADAQLASSSNLLGRAEEHLARAKDAGDAAVKAFALAERSAKSAATAASRRSSAARSAAGGVKGPEAQRLKMITEDGDMEASMHCLIAEAAYQTALTRGQQIEASQTWHGAAEYVASIGEADAPPSIEADLDGLRTEAVNKLAEANQSYEKAVSLIARTRSAKSGGGSIRGQDYVWQVQVGQAAIHLLHAALLPDPDDSFPEKSAAFDLLKEAAKGREQSPLLLPALETVSYLQQSVR